MSYTEERESLRALGGVFVGVQQWAVVASVWGSGSLLIGPHGRQGAQALVPNGVLAPSCGGDGELSRAGWRLLTWELADGPSAVQRRRPDTVEAIDVVAAAVYVNFYATERAAWLQDRVRADLANLDVLLWHSDADGETLIDVARDRDELLDDARRAFGACWVVERERDAERLRLPAA